MADDDDRWTVRGVTKAVRDAAADAAQRRKVTVGAWLTGAIDREVRAEREPLDLLPRPAADNSSDMADARLAMIERAVASAVALAGARGVPKVFRQQANHLLRESLPEPLTTMVASDRRLKLRAPGVPAPGGPDNPGPDAKNGTPHNLGVSEINVGG